MILTLITTRSLFFFFNDTATTEIYTLSLHDALPIFTTAASARRHPISQRLNDHTMEFWPIGWSQRIGQNSRSEEHTSELQSRLHLVCRLLLEKKKKKTDRVRL